ncbi:RraA family protein [Leifsonia poae]|uniref:RraA family protein n=1 Tax=Leifsonia poae TaxID=110933 RepID=UPI001CC06340|nr:RraA family protein [Leifsonia poae]
MVTIDLARVRAHLGSSVLSDMLDAVGLRHQCLAAGLVPLEADTVIAGYAFPVTIRRVFDVPETPFAGLVAALDAIGPDEVFITPTQRARDIAVWGELLSTACIARGAAGAITDGLVRDTRQVRGLGFPVVSGGTIPYDSMGRHEITAHRVPCAIDGVRIEPGDLVVADSDGVVVVPAARAAEIVEAALAKRSSELEFRQAVADGMLASDAFRTFGVL